MHRKATIASLRALVEQAYKVDREVALLEGKLNEARARQIDVHRWVEIELQRLVAP